MEGSAQTAGRGTTRTIEISLHSWWDILPEEILDRKLAYCGSYDLRRVNLVVNPDIAWAQVHLQLRKAVQSSIIGTDGKSYRKLSIYKEGYRLAEGETLVEDGWNHEHCVFCTRRIDIGDVGYRSDHEDFGDEWVCGWCFHHAVVLHDLGPLFTPYANRF